jgi:hypothetical protein
MFTLGDGEAVAHLFHTILPAPIRRRRQLILLRIGAEIKAKGCSAPGAMVKEMIRISSLTR